MLGVHSAFVIPRSLRVGSGTVFRWHYRSDLSGDVRNSMSVKRTHRAHVFCDYLPTNGLRRTLDYKLIPTLLRVV